jgi:hypothetical protein
MKPKKTIVPTKIDLLDIRPFWDEKEIQFSTAIALEVINSGDYRLFFDYLKTKFSTL